MIAEMSVIVTGGGGFIGGHVIRTLLNRGWAATSVASFDVTHPNVPDGVTRMTGDIANLGDVLQAFMGAQAVIHCSAPDPLENTNDTLMWRVNVNGTKNVIEACKQCKVRKLVYVSSASVVFDGGNLVDVTEKQPIPKRHLDAYARSKAAAEKHVLDANHGPLATCALRPSAVFGERDHAFLPAFIDAARFGGARFIIGGGKNVWSFTYVGNLAHACASALSKLEPDSQLAGQAYFITNDEHVPVWKFVGHLLSGLGHDSPRLCLPAFVCIFICYVLDIVLYLLRPVYQPRRKPGLSRTRVRLMVATRTFSCAKANEHFGYKPQVNLGEAAERTIEYFKAVDWQTDSESQSKE